MKKFDTGFNPHAFPEIFYPVRKVPSSFFFTKTLPCETVLAHICAPLCIQAGHNTVQILTFDHKNGNFC